MVEAGLLLNSSNILSTVQFYRIYELVFKSTNYIHVLRVCCRTIIIVSLSYSEQIYKTHWKKTWLYYIRFIRKTAKVSRFSYAIKMNFPWLAVRGIGYFRKTIVCYPSVWQIKFYLKCTLISIIFVYLDFLANQQQMFCTSQIKVEQFNYNYLYIMNSILFCSKPKWWYFSVFQWICF